MKFAVLSSGSKANCTYWECGGAALLIDCGLSAREAKKRMEQIGIDPGKIRGILVTHEHSDHIKGLSVLSRSLEIPVYANKATAKYLKDMYALENFNTGQSFNLLGAEIQPFSITHDAADPVGFVIQSGEGKFVQVTDLGRVTTLVKSALQGAQALVLEANYDQQRLYECDYPWVLKQRINSVHGHLSNHDSAALLADIKHADLDHVVLGHLSENSNTPELVIETFKRFVDFSEFKSIRCGTVHETSPLLTVGRAK